MLCANGNLPRKGQVRTDPTIGSRSYTPTSIHTEHGCVSGGTVPYGRSSDVVAARKTRARREIARNRLR